MKNVILFLFIIIALANTACTKRSEKDTTAGGRTLRMQKQVTDSRYTTKTNSDFAGTIVGLAQDDFQESVSRFVSATVNPNDSSFGLGMVSPLEGDTTGVQFGGYIKFSKSFSPQYGFPDGIELSTSKFIVRVWDDKASRGEAPSVYMDQFKLQSYNLKSDPYYGQTLSLIFKDNYGIIQLDGNLVGDYFEGVIKYKNARFWDGQIDGGSGVIGAFYVETCKFFVCSPN